MRNACALVAICALGTLAMSQLAAAQTYKTVDYPGALQMVPITVNHGTVAGLYYDEQWQSHAFLMSADGVFSSFDGPAGNSLFGPYPVTLNDRGDTAGYYYDNGDIPHGFVRSADGTFTSFDAPYAFIGGGTTVIGMSQDGTITGYYFDDLNNSHTFTRAPNGTFARTDVSKSSATQPMAENQLGQVAGAYTDLKGLSHMFVGYPAGQFKTFGGPGCSDTPRINIRGDMVCGYADGNSTHGYLRLAGGKVTIVDYPGSRYTSLHGIDDQGNTAGTNSDQSGHNHSFIRSANGALTGADFPGAGVTDTFVFWMDAGGVVVGTYLDVNGYYHGYVRTP